MFEQDERAGLGSLVVKVIVMKGSRRKRSRSYRGCNMGRSPKTFSLDSDMDLIRVISDHIRGHVIRLTYAILRRFGYHRAIFSCNFQYYTHMDSG